VDKNKFLIKDEKKVKKNMNEKIVGTLLVVAMCIVCTVPAVVAQETPFVINGYVSYANGTVCNGSGVNITNTDTGENWYAKNVSTSNYYRLVLANSSDVNASEALRFVVTSPDGSQSKNIRFKVTENEVDNGGKFGYEITLAVPNQQTWYFTNDTVTGPTWDGGATYNRNMTKGMKGEDDKVTLAHGERVWFYADQVADCNVTFPADTWNVSYWVKATEADSGKRITTRFHGIDSKGAELPGSPYAEGHYDINNPPFFEEVTESFNPAGFTIPKGGRFTIEVLWAGGATGNLEIHCNPVGLDASQVTSPTSDPGYPIPELPTVLLLGLGLLVFVGYVRLRRRRE
jgi:MYXO-CTERM domain-containing protein